MKGDKYTLESQDWLVKFEEQLPPKLLEIKIKTREGCNIIKCLDRLTCDNICSEDGEILVPCHGHDPRYYKLISHLNLEVR